MGDAEANPAGSDRQGHDTRGYVRTATGTKTTTMPTSQTKDSHRLSPIGVPSARERSALTTWVIGWLFANACSHPGMLSTGTNAEETNVSGNSQINPNACVDSSFLSHRPMAAEIRHTAKPSPIASAIMPTAGPTPLLNRKPTT